MCRPPVVALNWNGQVWMDNQPVLFLYIEKKNTLARNRVGQFNGNTRIFGLMFYNICFSAMYYAALEGNLTKLKRLVQEGHDVKQRIQDGWTPLTVAAGEGHTDCIEWLLQHGAKLEGRSYLGRTALHHAAGNGHHSTVELLLQHKANPNATDKYGDSPIILAVRNNHYETVEMLLNNNANTARSSNKNETVADIFKQQITLQGATKKGCLKIIEFLLENGANSENRDVHGRTALHWAAATGNNSIIKLLLKYKMNVDVIDKEGKTPAVLAAHEEKFDTVDLLLKSGANPSMTSKQQKSVKDILKENITISKALENQHNYITMALLEDSVDVTSIAKHKDKNGNTLLHVAAHLQNPVCLEKLMKSGANLNAEDNNRDTPLHLALRQYKIERSWFGKNEPQCAKILLDRGAEVEGHGAGGRTVLHEAASRGAIDIIEFLLKYNVNINMTDNAGKTVLHEAASKGNTDMIKFLLKYNVNINMTDKAGNTPLKLALDDEKQECAMMMMQRGAKLHGSDKSSTVEPGNMVCALLIQYVQYNVYSG